MNETKKIKKPYEKNSTVLNKKNNKVENKKVSKKQSFFTMADYFHNTPEFSKFYKALS